MCAFPLQTLARANRNFYLFRVVCSLRIKYDKQSMSVISLMAKSQNSVPSTAPADSGSPSQTNITPVLKSEEQIELDVLLEELAEYIESEGGVLIP